MFGSTLHFHRIIFFFFILFNFPRYAYLRWSSRRSYRSHHHHRCCRREAFERSEQRSVMRENCYMCSVFVVFVARKERGTNALVLLLLNQMDEVINDYLYINEIMSFRAIQHLFIYILGFIFRLEHSKSECTNRQ